MLDSFDFFSRYNNGGMVTISSFGMSCFPDIYRCLRSSPAMSRKNLRNDRRKSVFFYIKHRFASLPISLSFPRLLKCLGYIEKFNNQNHRYPR